MNTDIKRARESSVRLPKKEALHHQSPDKEELRRCQSCQSLWAEGNTSCLACGAVMPVIEDFRASHDIITLGEPVRLFWDVKNADAVWLEHEEEALPLSGQEDVFPMASTSYVLIAESPAGMVRREIQLSLPTPDISRFEVNQREIDLSYPVIFSWEASNAEIVTIEPGVGEVSGLSFCEAHLSKPGVYELRVKNATGEARAKVFLTLPRPEIGLFTILQDHVEPGEPHLIHWEVDNADTLTLMPDGIDVSGQTQMEVFPDRSTTYRLIAKNAAGEVEETAFIPLHKPLIAEFSSPKPISTEGESIELKWDVKYAYRVEIDPVIGEVPAQGTASYRPKNAFTEFRLRAIGHSGVSTAFITVSRFPLPLEDFSEDDLFREIHQSIKSHEKMLRRQAKDLTTARFLPSELEETNPDELLKPGSVTAEIKKNLRSLFRKKPSNHS